MCGYFCTGFIDFMLKGKILLEYANLFFPKISYILKKTLGLSIVYLNVVMNMEKYLKKENQLNY